MVKELLEKGDSSKAADIAQAIRSHDPMQIEYYSQVVKNMVGRVLTKNRGITTREGDTYSLGGAGDLSDEQRKDLMRICDKSIETYLEARGEAIWSQLGKSSDLVLDIRWGLQNAIPTEELLLDCWSLILVGIPGGGFY